MPVIYRNRLFGEAKDIADRAINKQIAMGDNSLIALNQQQKIIDSTQQQLVLSANQSLKDVQDNIYQAQRQSRAQNAMLGFSGAVADIRQQTQLQDQVSNTLDDVINSIDSNAIGIAGQQQALEEAKIQTAAPTILDTYADVLIHQGKAKQDTGRMVFNGLTGAIGGAIEGAIGGTIFGSGAKALLSPTKSLFKKALGGAAMLGSLGYGTNSIGKLVNIGNENFGNGETLYDQETSKFVSQGTILGGALGGLALGRTNLGSKGLVNKAYNFVSQGKDYSYFDIGKLDSKGNLIERLGKVKATSLDDAIKAAAGKGGQVLEGNLVRSTTKALNKASKLTKLNPIMIGVAAALGALTGGLKGGLDKKYKLNLNDIANDTTFKQFEDFGLDVGQLVDIVYNK